MICRIWHGWTAQEKADAYEALLKNDIFIGIQNMDIEGYRGIQLLRRELENEVEFITIMKFDSIKSVRAFAGDDYELAVVPEEAKKLLSRYDARSQHYNILVE